MVPGEIKINHTEAKRQAAALRAQATEVRTAVKQIQKNGINAVCKSWSDSLSAVYLTKAENSCKGLIQAADLMEEIASSIEQAADVWRNAENQKILNDNG